MSLEQITYEDKTNEKPTIDRSRQATAEDFNEIKTKFNNAIEVIGSMSPGVLNVNLGLLDQNSFKAIKLDVTSTNSYRERVVLLIPMVSTSTYHHNKMYGRIIASKTGGNVWNTFDISAQSVYNNTFAAFSATGQHYQHKLVTLTYEGTDWIALQFAYHANPYDNYWFEGFHIADPSLDTNGNALRVIDYYNQETLTVINAEINNSIQDYTDLTYRKISSEVHVDGNVNCTALIQTSDKEYKKNIEKIDGEWALSIFKKLSFSFYDFSKTNRKQAGLIAQEVEKILPRAVHTSQSGEKGLDHTYIDMVCKAGIQYFIKTQIQ